jgi:Ribonucleotide reductase, small chain
LLLEPLLAIDRRTFAKGSWTVYSFNAVSSIKKKTAWIQRHISDSGDHFSMRLLALAIYNKVFGTGLLSLLFHLGQEELKLPGLVHAGAKMRHDFETYFQALLIIRKDVIAKPSQGSVYAMVRGAVKMEQDLVDEVQKLCSSLELPLPINASAIKLRVECVADETLKSLGYAPMFKTKDPMPWIKTFADKEAKKYHVHEQVKTKAAAAGGKALDNTASFSVDEDF